jgi:hypothetical protein
MCLFAILAGLFPRVAFAVYWIARPSAVSAVFGGALIWPFLGLIFLPFTTLMYTLLYLPNGLTGFDWVWVGIAFVLDVGHYSYSAYGNRDQIPGYTA